MQSSALKYPYQPGFQFRDTSKRAANQMRGAAKTLRDSCRKVLELGGFTADEVAERLGQSVLTIRPRITELQKQGEIFDTGARRKNKSGKNAIVWGLK